MILKNTGELEDSKRRFEISPNRVNSRSFVFYGHLPLIPIVHIFTGRMTDIEKRNKTFLIRLNDEEYEVIKKRAEKLNMRFAVYVRHIAVQGEMKCFDLAELREVTRPFRMIGNELNQIAKKANETGEVTAKAVEEVREQYARLEKVFEKYLRPLKPNVLME